MESGFALPVLGGLRKIPQGGLIQLLFSCPVFFLAEYQTWWLSQQLFHYHKDESPDREAEGRAGRIPHVSVTIYLWIFLHMSLFCDHWTNHNGESAVFIRGFSLVWHLMKRQVGECHCVGLTWMPLVCCRDVLRPSVGSPVDSAWVTL